MSSEHQGSGGYLKLIERLRYRYFRKTIAHPEGAYVHHGDCQLGSCDLNICTCGLHHDLLVMNDDDIKAIYPQFYEEWENHSGGAIACLLGTFERGELYEVCDKCSGEGCEHCCQTGFRKFQLPEPVSEEQMKRIFEEAGWSVEERRKKRETLTPEEHIIALTNLSELRGKQVDDALEEIKQLKKQLEGRNNESKG